MKRTLGFRKDLPKKAVSIVNASSPLIECASKTCKKVEEARVLINLLQFKYRFSLSVTEENEAKKKSGETHSLRAFGEIKVPTVEAS